MRLAIPAQNVSHYPIALLFTWSISQSSTAQSSQFVELCKYSEWINTGQAVTIVAEGMRGHWHGCTLD